MSTNKHAIVERMESKPKYMSHAQGYALAETLVVILIVLAVCGIIAAFNALLPKGW